MADTKQADVKLPESSEEAVKKKSQFIEVMKRLGDNKGAVAGGIIFAVIVLLAILAPLLTPYDYSGYDIPNRLLGPCLAHPFGTDQMGRDILTRVLYGARYSLLIGLGSVVFSAVFGVILGAIAGYFGGWIDNLFMRVCDIVQSIPGMILNITLACALGPGVLNVILALGIEGIAGTARLMRSAILNVRKMEYLDAAVTSNCGSVWIIVKHVSIQAQVLNLLKKLQQDRNLTYIFITHDLSVVKHISNDICVMYLGQLVETSPAKELFATQYHPYTKALLSAIPSTDIRHKMSRIVLKGEITSPIDPKPGCRFAARCPYASEQCQQPQQLEEVAPNHFVSCCKVREVNGLS